MKKKLFYIYLPLVIILYLALTSHAQMQSDNYTMPTTVQPSGSSHMSSDNFETDTTLGQPSPIMDPADPPGSANYELYPGFYYTLDAVLTGCDDISSFAGRYGPISSDPNYSGACDMDGDGDIDGGDLAEFATGLE